MGNAFFYEYWLKKVSDVSRTFTYVRNQERRLFFLCYSLAIIANNQLTSQRTILKSNAFKKSPTTNPVTRFATRRISPALITNEKSPSVSTLIGSVRSVIKGLMIKLTSPSTIATMSATQYGSIETPGMR